MDVINDKLLPRSRGFKDSVNDRRPATGPLVGLLQLQ